MRKSEIRVPDLELRIPIFKVEPQQRTRWGGRGGGHMYQPKSLSRQEFGRYLTLYKDRLTEQIDGPVRVEIECYMKRYRGDFDNTAKPYVDELAAHHIISDDKYVHEHEFKRWIYTGEPKTARVHSSNFQLDGLFKRKGKLHNGLPVFFNGYYYLYYNGKQWNLHGSLDDSMLEYYCSKESNCVGAIRDPWILANDSGDEELSKSFSVYIHYEFMVIRIYRLLGDRTVDVIPRMDDKYAVIYSGKSKVETELDLGLLEGI